MATKGRNGDSMLVHMAPSEVQGLHALALAHGENVTINPLTGLPEMFSLKKILKAALPAIAGFALGPAGFGLMSSAMAGLTVGGVTALSSGSLSKGLMAGLGAYGGAQLSAGVAGAGAGAAQQAAISGLGEGASQAAMNEAAAAATKNYLGMEGATAALGAGERFMQGIGAVAKDPSAFAQGMGGLGKTLQAGMMAASPVLADQAVETTTGMPGYTPSTAYYRPYEFDPETKGLKSLGSVEAKGMAGGGMVAFANGGINNALTYDTQEKLRANMARSTPTEALFDFDTAGLGANWRNLVANDPAKAQQLQTQLGWGGKYQSDALMSVAGLGSLPAAAAPKTATGGISDLVYRPLSEVNEKARAQGIGKDPLNDRAQGLEKAVRDLGLQDVHNQYGAVVNTSNDPRYSASGGNKYDPKFNYMEGAALDPNLQKYWMNAVAEDSSEQERQASARQLIDRLAALQGGAKTPAALPFTPTSPPEITSTEANRPTTTITPSTYSVRGEQIAPQTPTTPPEITSTMAARPVASITPSQLYTQQAAAVPLTSTAPPAITATAAPTMPSMPVGGGGSAGAAAIRPFDYQSVPIERLPEFDPQDAEDVMTGESLAAYQRLIGVGARSQQRTNAPQSSSAGYVTNAPQSSSVGYVTNPFGQRISSDAYRFMNGPTNVHPETLGLDAGRDPVTGEAYQWAWKDGQWHVAKSNPLPSSAPSGGGLLGQVARIAGKVLRPGGIADSVRAPTTETVGFRRLFRSTFAQGGPVPGYALGGQAEYNLGGYSDGGRLLRGPGDGVSDSIPATIGDKQPARLADGEFVVPARIVSELGNGSTESGARKLYTMMDRVQRARGQTTGANSVATNSHADQYLPA
jgi:hypothetical protein